MNSQLAKGTSVLLVLWALTAVACGGAPRSNFYTIGYTPPEHSSAAPAMAKLGVEIPRASHLLRQDRIVYFTTQNEMNFYQYHRWGEPPVFLVQSLLIRHLRAADLFRNVVPYRAQKGLDYVLRGRLLAMEEVDTPTEVTARFGLELELVRQKDTQVIWTGRASRQRPASAKTVPALVEAMNGCVHESLQELTASLRGVVSELEPAGETSE